MWSKGSIKVHDSIIHYWVKHFEEASVYGIEEGRISKLTLEREDKTVASYDRGWDVETVDEDAEIALAILMSKYN